MEELIGIGFGMVGVSHALICTLLGIIVYTAIVHAFFSSTHVQNMCASMLEPCAICLPPCEVDLDVPSRAEIQQTHCGLTRQWAEVA